MKHTRASVLVLLLCACAAFATACATRVAEHADPVVADLALTGVRVVDVERGTISSEQTIAIRGNRIVWIGAADGARFPDDTRRVDARGMYVIPGLWDMHVHVMYRQGYDVFAPLFVANGITGIRDMGNSPMPLESVRQLRAEVARGDRIGPRFIAAGPLLDGPASFWPFALKIGSPEQGVRVVDSLHAEGAEFLKVYSGLSQASFEAIARRAAELQLPLAGHVPDAVPIASAAALGQRSMEHLLGLHEACAANPDAIAAERARLQAARAAGDRSIDLDAANRAIFAVSVHDDARCRGLFASLAQRQLWLTPTLVVHRTSAFPLDSTRRHDPRIAYIAPPIRSWWTEHPRDTSAAAWQLRARRYAYDARLVGELHRAGIALLAGSDAPNRYVIPAFSLHEELAALVDAGLPAAAALRAATLEPARFLGATDSLGSVARGKIADLVLLTGNPLEDIRNTSRIHGVVLDGRYLGRSQLDSLMQSAMRAASR